MLKKEHYFSFSCFCLFLCHFFNSWRLVWFRCHLQSTVFYPSLIFFPPALGMRKGLWLKDPDPNRRYLRIKHARQVWNGGGVLLSALAGNQTSSPAATSPVFDLSGRVGNYFSLEAALTADQNHQPVFTSCLAASPFMCLLFSPHLAPPEVGPLSLGAVQTSELFRTSWVCE